MKNKSFAFLYVIVIAMAGFSTGCSTSIASADQQKIVDAEKDGQKLLSEMPLARNPTLESYINAIGKKLLAQPMAAQKKINVPISFHIMNVSASSDMSSFTIGGYVFLERGEIENATSEGEIAGVLAHEIAHNYLGHIITEPGYGWCMDYLQTCYDWHYQITRQEELDADDLGVRMMTSAGYDPEDLATNFLREAKLLTTYRQTSYPTHPSLYERVKRIRSLEKTLRISKKPPKNTPALKESKKLLRKIRPVVLI